MNSRVQEKAGGPRGGGVSAKRAKETKTKRAVRFSGKSGTARKCAVNGDVGTA